VVWFASAKYFVLHRFVSGQAPGAEVVGLESQAWSGQGSLMTFESKCPFYKESNEEQILKFLPLHQFNMNKYYI